MKYLDSYNTPRSRDALNMWGELAIKTIAHELLWRSSFQSLAVAETYRLCSSASPFRFKLEKWTRSLQRAPPLFSQMCTVWSYKESLLLGL